MLFVIRRQSSHVNGRAGSILRLVLHAEAVLIDVSCKIGVALFFSLNPNGSNLNDGLPSLYCLLLFGKVRGHEGSVTKKGQGLESYA